MFLHRVEVSRAYRSQHNQLLDFSGADYMMPLTCHAYQTVFPDRLATTFREQRSCKRRTIYTLVMHSHCLCSRTCLEGPQTGLFWQRGQLGTIQRVGKPEHPCCQHVNVPNVEVVDA